MADQISLDDIQETGLSTVTKPHRTRITAIKALQTLRQARKLANVDWITAKDLYERRKDLVQPPQCFRDANPPKSKEYLIITEKGTEDAPRTR